MKYTELHHTNLMDLTLDWYRVFESVIGSKISCDYRLSREKKDLQFFGYTLERCARILALESLIKTL